MSTQENHIQPATPAEVLVFDKVTKVYKNTQSPALEDISLQINEGEFAFLVGPSGSGKSTFLRLLLREDTPTSGTIRVAGTEVSSLPLRKAPAHRRRIGTVFQDFRLLQDKTAAENVAFALKVLGRNRSEVNEIIPEVFALVGLAGKEDRLPSELSGGEQQRVALARALANRPRLLLADEPTGNLDPSTAVGIMKILDRVNRAGTTVLVATHDVSIVNAMRRRVLQLDDGHLVRDENQGGYSGLV